MKRRNEKAKLNILPLLLVSLLLLSVSVGTVWAVAFMETGKLENEFQPASASIKLNESFDGTTKSNVYVTNAGSTTVPYGVPVYVRVKLLPYYYEADSDHIVAKSPWTPSFTPGDNWILKGEYYYYSLPLKAGENTSNLIDSITLGTDQEGHREVLEIAVEAIQSNPEDAVKESWQVSLDSNGHIKN